MSYQVLARKWRPRNFKELVGQEHVQRALINALDNDRLHHAFLFTGTRGVGKTTIARILAKSLNCETGVTSTPCGVCSTCTEINEGRFVDLIEVDAASRTKVEDTRELLENVQYAPTRGRYKVYLIDEVHMLSTHSFNALLKTLEEPPPHVKFLLATTDPQKLPVTILSRCLQFNLKRLPLEQIQTHLQHILSAEQIDSDAESLLQIAKAADGSMRDALSLLDQAIAYGGGAVRNDEVRAMLGTIEQQHVLDILQHLADGDALSVLQKTQLLAEHAFDFAAVLDDLVTHLHYVALAQISPQSLDSSVVDTQAIAALAASLAAEDVQLFYQIALIGRRDLALVPDPRLGFEMVLLRMLAFKPAEAGSIKPPPAAASKSPVADARAAIRGSTPPSTVAQSSVADSSSAQHTRAAPSTTVSTATNAVMADRKLDTEPVDTQAQRSPRQPSTTPAGASTSAVSNEIQPPAAVAEPAPAAASANTLSSTTQSAAKAEDAGAMQWYQLVERLDVAGITQQLALNCACTLQSSDCITLQLAESRQHLLNPSRQETLRQALKTSLGSEIKLTIEVVTATGNTPAEIKARQAAEKQQDAEKSIYSDQTVKTLINTFDAQVAPGSIAPIDQSPGS
ncbi:MAG: DNA polymerase III subunit gamma/tau [Gammaproteobacteria bacterium]|nr:DNA polymerase III subunit gamma/tau [Gammaproteobacteria bacterium]